MYSKIKMLLFKKNLRNYFCKIINRINLFLNFKNNSKIQLRVLIIHSTDNKNELVKLLSHLNKKWSFITPDQFFKFMESKQNLKKPSLLITFDDGFKNNLNVIPILKRFSISALFFVCPGLVELQSSNLLFPLLAKKSFGISPIKRDIELLNWDDLRFIQKQGHSIGNHSSFHYQLNKLNREQLIEDINLSKRLLEKNLTYNQSFESFSYPFGGVKHINLLCLSFLSRNFKYIFSGIRGDNNNRHKSKMIFRDAVSINDHLEITDSFLMGGFDFYYRFQLLKIIF